MWVNYAGVAFSVEGSMQTKQIAKLKEETKKYNRENKALSKRVTVAERERDEHVRWLSK